MLGTKWFEVLARGYHHPNRQLPEHVPSRTIGYLRKQGFIVSYDPDEYVWILTDAGVRYVERFVS